MKRVLSIICFLLLLVENSFSINVGEVAPDFSLKAFNGGQIKLSQFKRKIVVLEWFDPYCPGGQKYYSQGHIQNMQEAFRKKGVIWLAVSSTSKRYEDAMSDDKIKRRYADGDVKADYVLDDSLGKVGNLYQATTVPEFVIIDVDGRVAYHGTIDEDMDFFTIPSDEKNLVKPALLAIIEGRMPERPETKPYGCPIKYAD